MIFVRDGGAEDHHDVYVVAADVAGWRRGGYSKGWPVLRRCMRSSPMTPSSLVTWWWASKPTAANRCRPWAWPGIRCSQSTRRRWPAIAIATKCLGEGDTKRDLVRIHSAEFAQYWPRYASCPRGAEQNTQPLSVVLPTSSPPPTPPDRRPNTIGPRRSWPTESDGIGPGTAGHALDDQPASSSKMPSLRRGQAARSLVHQRSSAPGA